MEVKNILGFEAILKKAEKERFYAGFKTDFGDPSRYKTFGELTAAIYLQIHYYNYKRIHSKLKMPPESYAQAAHKTTNLILITS